MNKSMYLIGLCFIFCNSRSFSQNIKKDSFNVTKTLAGINIRSTKPFVQHSQGKIIINVDASATNAGASVLEVLEKSPGIIVGKNGALTLQGKSSVQVLIDGKPNYLSESELNTLLESMSSSEVDQIELISNPSAKYDAKGNGGIINIKTKHSKKEGFNGNITASFGMGKYPKSINTITMNYRKGNFNAYLLLTSNIVKSFTDYYAVRKYLTNDRALISSLIQPTDYTQFTLNNTFKTGFEYYATPKTTLGMQITGLMVSRKGEGVSSATWKNNSGITDSVLLAASSSQTAFRNAAINLNFKYNLTKAQSISTDVDLLKYDLQSNQFFNNYSGQTGATTFGSRGSLPSSIDIFSFKTDHSLVIGKDGKLESGFKSSMVNTDNIAKYELSDGSQWAPDYGKSNHFIYKEKIAALYSSLEEKIGRFNWQSGIRFETTHYDAHQLGNLERKDSAFSNHYSGFFPSGYLSYKIDTFNNITFTAGRRIDRPAFQKLNPFVTLFNKYTYNRGNPFYRPQYSWNFELSHQFKQWLTTSVSYSVIKDYFSQLFLSEGNNILVYTEGNVGRMYNIGAAMAVELHPFKWWSASTQFIYNHKKLKDYQQVKYVSQVSQCNISVNNQFQINPKITAEVSGFYTSKARNDIQELLLPTGEVSFGISKLVCNNRGSLKLSTRDIFNSNTMSGNTDFPNATEYFIVRQDRRVVTIAFTYRFGKSTKTSKTNSGSVKDEIQRVGTG
ncbi:MAG: outer membrane beta-barrel family protein [Ginsengibacter sp.]